MTRVLVVDDEIQIQRFLRITFEAHGFGVEMATTGNEAIARCATGHPDLVILDLGLPDRDGKEVVTSIREWSTVPIVVLSVRGAETEKVAALDAGANDYVVKPFGMAELMARMRALLRHSGRLGDPETTQWTVGDLTVDLAQRQVMLRGVSIKLTRKEFDLLRILIVNAGRVVTHRHLLREVWGKVHERDTQGLRVFIGQLRQKLNDDPTNPTYILNEPGVGYQFLQPN